MKTQRAEYLLSEFEFAGLRCLRQNTISHHFYKELKAWNTL
jgi:hypothetical protein